MQTNQTVETRVVLADSTALGVFGLAVVTFVASTAKLGWVAGSAYLIPWALFLGSLAQLTASIIDFLRNNYFGAIVLGAFGFFWIAVSMHWAIALGWFGDVGTSDPRHFGVACLAYLFFCFFITIATLEVNKVFFVIMLLVDTLLLSLVLATFKIAPDLFNPLAAWSELLIGLLGFYAAGTIFLNNFFARPILPLGKPFGLIKKG